MVHCCNEFPFDYFCWIVAMKLTLSLDYTFLSALVIINEDGEELLK